ncbi:MAG TPA: hypothetical protein VF816_02525 [Rhodocyclaceae bacterium]
MAALSVFLLAASAGIVFLLGIAHLLLTFRGSAMVPRDPDLVARMQGVSPFITDETSMWQAWLGFNASHGFGAILFGAVYGYLSLAHGEFLFRSPFLLSLGLLLLMGYVLLAKRYWFSRPLRAILVATSLYIAALLVAAV